MFLQLVSNIIFSAQENNFEKNNVPFKNNKENNKIFVYSTQPSDGNHDLNYFEEIQSEHIFRF